MTSPVPVLHGEVVAPGGVSTASSPWSTAAEAIDLLAGRPLVVLTGAGLSTDSGIPDYRGPGSVPRQPMTYAEFVSGTAARQRYWARVHTGFGRFSAAAPNAGHLALARLDPELLITQNVDGLHEAAGSRRLVALHGRIADVICLDCRATSPRTTLEHRLTELNPGWRERYAELALRPDGDVELTDWSGFRVADCEGCGGVLKPDVVFFGENVPPRRVARCYEAVDALAARRDGRPAPSSGTAPRDGRPAPSSGTAGGALLVAGSSLAVMSGLRFVKRAAKAGVPVVIANRGATRGDGVATYKLEVGCSEFLTELAG